MSLKSYLSAILLVLTLTSCVSARNHQDEVSEVGGNLTVGTVQKEIRIGMSAAEVAQVLGSPNIVTTDDTRLEVWIYDKIASSTAYSRSSGGIAALILGIDPTGGAGFGGGASGSYNKNAGASATSQRTLTVIIKFDKNSNVRDFAYNTSRF